MSALCGGPAPESRDGRDTTRGVCTAGRTRGAPTCSLLSPSEKLQVP